MMEYYKLNEQPQKTRKKPQRLHSKVYNTEKNAIGNVKGGQRKERQENSKR